MLRVTLKSLLARKLRLLLSGAAVVLGVAFVAGVFVFSDSLTRTFDDLFATVGEGISVTVQADDSVEAAADGGFSAPSVPAEVVDLVRGVDGAAVVEPYVSGPVQLVAADGTAYSSGGAPVFGQSWSDDADLNPFTVTDGRAPEATGEVVLDEPTAEGAGYVLGDTVRYVAAEGPGEAELVGVATFGTSGNIAGAGILSFELDDALRLFSPDGSVETVDVVAADDVDDVELRDRVAAVLPAGTEALTGDQAADEASSDLGEALGFFRTFLLVFAAVALLVGSFLIVNTFNIVVAQRSRELALLRAVGASKAQVRRSVLVEAAVVGLVASVVGLVLGIGLAVGLRALIGAVLGGSLPDTGLVVAPRTVVVALAVGLVVTLLAALLPARRAASVAPVEALRDAALPRTSGRTGPLVGLVLAVGGVLLLVPGLGGNLPLLGLGALGIFVGVALLSPVIAVPLASAIGWTMARGVPGRLGRRNSVRNPGRTATTAAALMVGVALVAAVGVAASSVKASVTDVIDSTFGADLTVQDTSFIGLPPAAGDALAALDEVERADRLRFASLDVDGQDLDVVGVTEGAVGTTVALSSADGDVEALDAGTVDLDVDVAADLGVSVGDTVTLSDGGTSRDLEVVGTYEPNALAGSVLVEASTLAGLDDQRFDAVVLVQRAEDATAEQLRSAVDSVVGAGTEYPQGEVQDRQEFVDSQAGQVDQLLLFINALLALSVIIAVLGIVNTLALSVVERTRELGMLRAVGLSRAQTRRMIRVEAVVVAVFGALLGLLLGTPLGIAVVRALQDQGITELEVPYGQLFAAVVVAGVAGVLAAVIPARRASRVDVLTALRTE